MKYVALVYLQESLINAMTEKEWHDLNQECVGCVEKLTHQGNYLAGEALQPTTDATTIRIRDGETVVSDGPFAETKEQLLGFYLIECKDLDEAIEVARELEIANPGGTHEVRPVGLYSPVPATL